MLSIQELKSSNMSELEKELDNSQSELLKIRIALKTKHEKDSSKLQKIKKYIARIQTVMFEVKKEDIEKELKDKKTDK